MTMKIKKNLPIYLLSAALVSVSVASIPQAQSATSPTSAQFVSLQNQVYQLQAQVNSLQSFKSCVSSNLFRLSMYRGDGSFPMIFNCWFSKFLEINVLECTRLPLDFWDWSDFALADSFELMIFSWLATCKKEWGFLQKVEIKLVLWCTCLVPILEEKILDPFHFLPEKHRLQP